MTGIVVSEVKVSSKVAVVVRLPSVTVRDTLKLPSDVGVPEIWPVTGSKLKPGGKPLALSRAAAVPPLVIT